jgi:hypothetical protein
MTSTATAIPAPEPAAEESASEVMFVLTLEVIETSPFGVEIELVSETWLFPFARTNVATTEESFCSAAVHLPSRPSSSLGAVVLLAWSFVAAYFLFESEVSMTTSPLV